MRALGIFVAAICVLPLAAGDGSDPESLKGKHRDEIVAVWGPPTTIKRHDRGKEVLVYVFVFPGDRLIEAGEYGFEDPTGLEGSGICVTQEMGRVRGRARFKLYLDSDGYVVKVKQRTKRADGMPEDADPASLRGPEFDTAVKAGRKSAAAQPAE